MAQIAAWQRKQLINIYDEGRKKARCVIVKELKRDADDFTKDIKKELQTIEMRKKELETKLYNVLEKHCLNNLVPPKYGACSLDKEHPKLIKFDNETREGLITLLQGD